MSNPTTPNAILVIDDEDIVREAIIDILESIDISVLSASSGQEGISLFQTHQTTIGGILLDMKMPGLNGTQTLHALRQINPHIPVILSSGYSEIETKEAFPDQNNLIFLPKPYNLDELISKVEGLFA